MHATQIVITTDYITILGLLSCEAHTIIRVQNLEYQLVNYDNVMYMNPKRNDMYMNTKYIIHSKYLDSIVNIITHMYKPISTRGNTVWITQLSLPKTTPPK